MNNFQQLTIRGVDETTKRLLETRARKYGISLNAYNLELLRREVGTSSISKTNGLERFIGVAPFDSMVEEALKDQRKPTPDKWDSNDL
jgi:plasmid stability protein